MDAREGPLATSGDQATDDAAVQQQAIGLELLPRGFLAKGWKDAMEKGRMEQLEHKMTHLQRILWSTVMEPIWRKRCELQYGKDTREEAENDIRLGDRIQRYVANKHNVLPAYDSRLVKFISQRYTE
jgi:hypothetical protein